MPYSGSGLKYWNKPQLKPQAPDEEEPLLLLLSALGCFLRDFLPFCFYFLPGNFPGHLNSSLPVHWHALRSYRWFLLFWLSLMLGFGCEVGHVYSKHSDINTTAAQAQILGTINKKLKILFSLGNGIMGIFTVFSKFVFSVTITYFL